MGALGSQQLWEEELLDTAAGKEDKEQLVAREIEKYNIWSTTLQSLPTPIEMDKNSCLQVPLGY